MTEQSKLRERIFGKPETPDPRKQPIKTEAELEQAIEAAVARLYEIKSPAAGRVEIRGNDDPGFERFLDAGIEQKRNRKR